MTETAWLDNNPRATANATAAVPSLKRLSDSISSLMRPLALASRKVAITETGSVAEMNAPKINAVVQSHPTSQSIPAAVAVSDNHTPRTDRDRTTGICLRNSLQWR